MKRIFSILLSMAMLLSLMPQLTMLAHAGATVKTLCFDDYVDFTGKAVEILDAGSSAQGPVLTLDGSCLIATGIGTAKVRIDGAVQQINVKKAKINLVMIMGQSNAGNHFPNATSDVTCPMGTAYWWGNGQGTKAQEPVPYTQPSMGFHTPLLAELYAQSVAAGDPVKNVMIWHEGITSKNGQSIVKWASGATNTSGTDDAVTMLENCRAYYETFSDRYEIVGSGVYWLQGESDESMDPAKYTQCFMAMWQRLKSAGMEYLAFLRVRRNVYNSPANRDDLRHSASLSAQIKMINENPEFYMATTLTENWIGTPSVLHTIDVSNYLTVMETYGKSSSYTDSYGNDATYAEGKLTTTMKTLYGSNNTCHYGKFGYALIGADAAYHMYKSLNGDHAAMVITDTSGYAGRARVLTGGQSVSIDIDQMTDDLSIRPACGSTSGTLKFVVRSGVTDITNREGVIVSTGEKYGAISTSVLRGYENVSIVITYTTAAGAVHTAICNVDGGAVELQKDYVWEFNEDLKARGTDGEVLNSFVEQALTGSYTIQNGYLTGTGLQLQLENTIQLNATKNWSIEWKYGSLSNGTAGFLLCEDKGNTVGNRALWHIKRGSFAIADYLDSEGYRNYTSADVIIQDYDCVKLTNTYDPTTGKCTVDLWINGELRISDFQKKGCLNNYYDNQDMTRYPLVPDFAFRYLGNNGMSDWRVNCQLDYLKISFGEICDHSYRAQITNPASCETDGIMTYLCSECGDSYTELIPATGHSYNAYVTGPTCTAQGYTTYTCRHCGDSYTADRKPANGHSYNTHVVAPTCTTQGYTTYTCSNCADSYTADQTAATGHSYSGNACTRCGAANPDYVSTYYLVGYINGADYGCEGDWKNMGDYRFVDGKLVVTFVQDSYVFLKTEGNAAWYMTQSYCTDTTATFRNTNSGTTEKLFVPGGVELSLSLIHISEPTRRS